MKSYSIGLAVTSNCFNCLAYDVKQVLVQDVGMYAF